MNPIFLEWYTNSADFRVLMVTDPFLAEQVNSGISPLELVIKLVDRAENMKIAINTIYENGKMKGTYVNHQ
jgi:hypothetical protein